jgi:short-subunit dehydrogenase
MGKWLRAVLDGRPWWMNLLMIFSAYMALIYVPWDLFVKPVAEDEEVWFGIMFHGWAAKAAAPLHWAVYAAGAYGFRKMRSWMWPWASVYAAQVAVGMLVWSVVYGGGGAVGWLLGLAALVPFAVISAALWRARPLFGPTPLRERYGEWALITGASAGIGAAFARELAREGISCVLTARREERLQALAAELEERHGVATRTVPVDLADADGVERLAQAVADLEVAVLVNNAGFGHAGRFEDNDPERLRAMIQLNCAAPVLLTSRLLPGMRARGRGAIVVVGSVAGRQPIPLHGVYSATKAFDLLFGESLYVELKGSGVDVVVLEPGSTDTEFQAVAGEIAHGGESPEQVARVGLDALGRQPSVIPGWFDWLRSNAAARLLPRPLVAHITEGVFAARVPPEKR